MEWLGGALSRELSWRKGHFETSCSRDGNGLYAIQLARNEAPVESSGALWRVVERGEEESSVRAQ